MAASTNEDVSKQLTQQINNLSINNVILAICANCGKDGSDLKACTACKMVKYCNQDCQIAHRPQHKKECKKHAAELHDEKLFKKPPPHEDCPICMLPLPPLYSGSTYKGQLSAVDAFMQLQNEMGVSADVHFAELQRLLQMR